MQICLSYVTFKTKPPKLYKKYLQLEINLFESFRFNHKTLSTMKVLIKFCKKVINFAESFNL